MYSSWKITGEPDFHKVEAANQEAFKEFCKKASVVDLISTSVDRYRFALLNGLDDMEVWSNDCALCKRFLKGRRYEQWCRGCPVAVMTGEGDCAKVPFGDGLKAVVEFGDRLLEWYIEWSAELACL